MRTLVYEATESTLGPTQSVTATRAADPQAIRRDEPGRCRALSERWRAALQGKDQILGVQLQLLQAHFFNLFVR